MDLAASTEPGSVTQLFAEWVAEVEGAHRSAAGAIAARRVAGSFQPRRAALMAATSIFVMVIIVSNARLASSPPAAIASVSTRGVICHDTPHLSWHQPHALA